MSRFLTALLILVCCSAAYAESVTYVCERPAWDGKKGCGPNNTYATYMMEVNRNDLELTSPKYDFRMRKGCDASKGRRHTYPLKVGEGKIAFLFKDTGQAMGVSQMSMITLDPDTMEAVLSGVEDSPNLSCKIVN